MGSLSILGNVEIEGVAVPAGDPGEQLIANLILLTIAFDLGADGTARKYLAQAHLLAMDLADQSPIYRPPRPSQFARLTVELDGLMETILLPVIGNILVLPAIAFTGGCETVPVAINLKALDIACFMLRLRPRRIASIIEALDHEAPGWQSTDAMRRILASCTRVELPLVEPLDRADGFLTLARKLTGKQNFPLATLALINADRALADAYAQTASASDHAAALLQMKQQIAQMLAELQQTAM